MSTNGSFPKSNPMVVRLGPDPQKFGPNETDYKYTPRGEMPYPEDTSIGFEAEDNRIEIKEAVARFPWTSPKSPVNSRFFPHIEIDGKRWDQLFPYRLLVIDVTRQNEVVNGAVNDVDVAVSYGASSAIIDFISYSDAWMFQLPISPQQLSIQDTFAINTVATLRGTLEEHNGVRFKTISAQGTMGVWPYRNSIAKPPSSPSPLQSVFGGTIEAFGNVVSSVSNTIRAATSGHPSAKPETARPEESDLSIATGYYQALFLQQFLEQYAEAKKSPKNAGWRLVFDIPKQNQSYIVTPMLYNWQQNANKPMEINYSIQFKAWRRVDLKEKVQTNDPELNTISPGMLQRIMNTLFEARKAVSAAIDLIKAVRSDIEAPLNALRQTALLVKDLAGAILTAADLPFQLQRDFKSAINSFFNSLSLNQLTGAASTDGATTRALKDMQSVNKTIEGLSISAVSGSAQLGKAASDLLSINPALNVFDDPEKHFLLMDQAPIASLVLSVPQLNAIDDEIQKARELTVDDLKGFKDTIQTLAFQLANNFGAGDATVSNIYSLPEPIARVTPMTMDNFQLLRVLYDTVSAFDTLTATTQIDDNNRQTSMEYVSGLADTSGIIFNTTEAKILAPVPFGLTMEQIAARYLNDPQRWLEIATLNNLRAPYIDEDGFQYPLLSNATGRQITVSSIENLFIGQRVSLKALNQQPAARRILSISTLSATSFLITLDGEPNLDIYTTVNQAYLQAYLPGTVNSQQPIYIPSDLAITNDANVPLPPIASADVMSSMSGVDWLLTEDGDVALNSFGDIRLSYGMTNLIQALKIKFRTIQGTYLLHPEFGLGIKPGTINSEVRLKELHDSINKMIKQDPRFDGVSNLQIKLAGKTLEINLGVKLANDNGVFPVRFELTA